MDELVRSGRAGRVAVIEMHRPERRHAMSTGLLRRLVEVLREASYDASVDAVVVTGSGGCFSSGADAADWLLNDTNLGPALRSRPDFQKLLKEWGA